MKRIPVFFVAALVCAPVFAGKWREDFDADLRYWNIHNVCAGVNRQGERSVTVEDGVAKIRDDSVCSIMASVGLFRLEPWTDYELTAKLKVIRFKYYPGFVTILVRAQRCLPKIPPAPVACRGGPPNYGFKAEPDHFLLLTPANARWNIQAASVILEQWYEVNIIADGPRVTYFLDGQKVKEEHIESVVTGGVVFLSEGVEFWLDEVEVSGDEILDISPTPKLTSTWGKIKAQP